MKNLILSALLTLAIGWEKLTGRRSSDKGWRLFTILRGTHFCLPRLIDPIWGVREVLFAVRFDQSAIYQTKDPVNQYDVNKLYGFSEGWDNQLHSARLGWAYNDGQVRLYGYVHNAGVVHVAELGILSWGLIQTCAIGIRGSEYVFTLNGEETTLPRSCKAATIRGWQQWPYFGGDEKAPHTITVKIANL